MRRVAFVGGGRGLRQHVERAQGAREAIIGAGIDPTTGLVEVNQEGLGIQDGILAAVELGLSNSKLEGLNSKIRPINHRGYGHHSAAAVIAMIYLCCGGITVQLPTER